MKPVFVFTNCDTSAEAEMIADTLVARRLAAAVQIVGPVSSRYRWQDKVRKKQEWLLIIKTSDQRREEIRSALEELHSYELPAMVSLDIGGGESRYLEWILSESTDRRPPTT